MSLRAGFGVVEALVALTVLSAGILAVTGVAAVAARHLGEAEDERRAARLAVRVADSLVLVPEPAPGIRAAGALVARWTLQPADKSTRLRLEVGRTGAPLHVFETLLAVPPPRLEEGW
ncbi:MAG: hypothetical protein WEA24_12955 [Gemmatimonadota bacterium]